MEDDEFVEEKCKPVAKSVPKPVNKEPVISRNNVENDKRNTNVNEEKKKSDELVKNVGSEEEKQDKGETGIMLKKGKSADMVKNVSADTPKNVSADDGEKIVPNKKKSVEQSKVPSIEDVEKQPEKAPERQPEKQAENQQDKSKHDDVKTAGAEDDNQEKQDKEKPSAEVVKTAGGEDGENQDKIEKNQLVEPVRVMPSAEDANRKPNDIDYEDEKSALPKSQRSKHDDKEEKSAFRSSRRKKKKKAPVQDPNNAVGQICNDFSWEDEATKKKKKKVKEDKKGKEKKTDSIREKDLKSARKMDGSGRKKKVSAPMEEKSFRRKNVKAFAPTNVKKNDVGAFLKKKNKHVQNFLASANKEGFWKNIVNKAKSTIQSRLGRYDDVFNPNAEVADKALEVHIDHAEDIEIPEPDPRYNENNGQLFIKGRPFWSQKDERPPSANNYVMTVALRDLSEGKWQLQNLSQTPKDLDIYNSMETMQGRDAELFKKDKKILSNTVRSLITMYDLKAKAKKGTLTSENSSHDAPSYNKNKITFITPHYAIQYNKRNRLSPTSKISFTPGLKKKKKTVRG